MPEAVIVSTARSPIGRAMKGSLVSIRPDDLAAQMVRAALDKVEALNPHQIDDLILGCGLPGGEQGFNMARVVAVELGYDFLPGTTVNRYCSSSLQTIRMAFHAIKAGEGDAFISAGVETVSRFVKGNSDSLPDTKNPLFDEAAQRTAAAVRWAASSNRGFLVSGKESELPLMNRDTVSTPAEMNASPSPALIAWKAIRMVCSDDEQ